MSNYPLSSSTWDEKELNAINSVIESDFYTMGAKVAAFEHDFAKFVGAKYAVMTSSGSTANLIATAALFYTKAPSLKRGDEVIVPAVSWSTTFFPLYQYGLKLKFVDVDLHTLNFDLNALENAISPRTKMIMCVNLLGNPNDFDAIFSLVKGRDIIILEDNCESMGATFKGRQAGTFGVMGTFSTFYSHHMATMEGGFVVTDDEELFHILLCLRAHGWTRNLPKINKVSGVKSDDDFEESFKFVLPGYNVRPVEMSGAIGIEQLKKLPKFLKTRRENARFFKTLFADNENFITQKELGQSSWFGFAFIVKNENLPRSVILRALQEANIDVRPIVAGDFTQNAVIRYFDYEICGELKNAKIIQNRGFFVGNHQLNLQNELKFLAKTLEKATNFALSKSADNEKRGGDFEYQQILIFKFSKFGKFSEFFAFSTLNFSKIYANLTPNLKQNLAFKNSSLNLKQNLAFKNSSLNLKQKISCLNSLKIQANFKPNLSSNLAKFAPKNSRKVA